MAWRQLCWHAAGSFLSSRHFGRHVWHFERRELGTGEAATVHSDIECDTVCWVGILAWPISVNCNNMTGIWQAVAQGMAGGMGFLAGWLAGF